MHVVQCTCDPLHGGLPLLLLVVNVVHSIITLNDYLISGDNSQHIACMSCTLASTPVRVTRTDGMLRKCSETVYAVQDWTPPPVDV